jgi:hypothetical protein
MMLSLSGVPDLGSRSTKTTLKPTQPSVVVKTASKEALKNAEGVLVCDAGASCRVSLRNARLFHGELLAPM